MCHHQSRHLPICHYNQTIYKYTHVPFTLLLLLLLLLNTTCTTIYNDAGTYVHAHVLRHCHMNSVQLLHHASLPSTTTSIYYTHSLSIYYTHISIIHPFLISCLGSLFLFMLSCILGIGPSSQVSISQQVQHTTLIVIASSLPLLSSPLHHPIIPSISYSTSHHPSHHAYKLPFCITLTRPCVSHISYSFHALQRRIKYLGFGSSQVRTNTDYGVAGVSPAPIYHTYSP